MVYNKKTIIDCMNLSFKNVLCVCCLLLSGSVYAQVPQDLIDKAKAAGMSDTQIQQELAKRMKQEGGSVGSQATGYRCEG